MEKDDKKFVAIARCRVILRSSLPTVLMQTSVSPPHPNAPNSLASCLEYQCESQFQPITHQNGMVLLDRAHAWIRPFYCNIPALFPSSGRVSWTILGPIDNDPLILAYSSTRSACVVLAVARKIWLVRRISLGLVALSQLPFAQQLAPPRRFIEREQAQALGTDLIVSLSTLQQHTELSSVPKGT